MFLLSILKLTGRSPARSFGRSVYSIDALRHCALSLGFMNGGIGTSSIIVI